MAQPGHHDATHSHGDHAGHGGHDDEHEHHGGYAQYMAVFLALCVLTTMSLLTYTDFWRQRLAEEVGWAFMMAVSFSKALLVILFFMHLKYEKSWKYILTIPTTMMAIFLVLMLVPDVGLRVNSYSEERTRHAAQPPVEAADAGKPATQSGHGEK
jgi:cytochrome c oxidase subunit IV